MENRWSKRQISKGKKTIAAKIRNLTLVESSTIQTSSGLFKSRTFKNSNTSYPAPFLFEL